MAMTAVTNKHLTFFYLDERSKNIKYETGERALLSAKSR